MSRGKTPGEKGGNVLEMTPETPATDDAPAETEPQTVETAEAAPSTPPVQQKGRRTTSGWDRVRSIPKLDWGTRAFLYIYCLEPICDLKGGGEKKYLVKLKQPIFDEDPIMIDYGSGKYRLQLVYRKPAADKSDQVDSWEIEIYNPKYPPKIPQTVWMNDPRNERWAALLPKDEPPAAPPTPLGSIGETFKVFSDMRKDVREELKPTTPAATSENPVATALSMAKDLLQMRADNPMVDILRDQMNALRTEMKEERDRGRELQDRLMQGKAGPPASGVDTAIEFMNKLQPLIDKFGPKLTEAAGNVVGRASRPRPLEQMIDIGLPILGDVLKPFANLIAMKMAAAPQPANGAYPAPAAPTTIQQPPQPGIAAAPAPAQPRLIQFFQQPIVMGAFQSHFKDYLESGGGEDGTDGSDFAYWIYKAVGEGPLTDARAMGTTAILGMFKAAPQWAAIQQHETKLTAFIDEILGWKPEAMEPEPDNQVEDLTQTT
jgi:hypothetical protein